jgi:hypothetical protein
METRDVDQSFCEKTSRVKKEMPVTGSGLEKTIFGIKKNRQKEV